MKPLLILSLLGSVLRPGSSMPLNTTSSSTTASLAPRDGASSGANWSDPIGTIPRGSFSFLTHSGKLEFYSQLNSAWYVHGMTVKPCDMQDVHPWPTAGWKNLSAEDPTHFDMPFDFWFHPGNQCGGAHSRGQQLDNTWVFYQGAGADQINVLTDTRCGEYHFSNPSPSEWTQVLAFRCILPLGVNQAKKPKPHIGLSTKPLKAWEIQAEKGHHRSDKHLSSSKKTG